jgi:hypothetical protein
MTVPNDAVLAEYRSVRSEIEQLNGQLFLAWSAALTLDMTILGWFFTRDNPSRYFLIPTIGNIILFLAAILVLNRNRLSHRLAYFQRYFIERRVPDICWARVYFRYRELYPTNSSFSERLADSAVYVLVFAALINVVVLFIFGIGPYVPGQHVQFIWRLVNVAVAIAFVCFFYPLQRVMIDYSAIERAMLTISEETGLTTATATDGGLDNTSATEVPGSRPPVSGNSSWSSPRAAGYFHLGRIL